MPGSILWEFCHPEARPLQVIYGSGTGAYSGDTVVTGRANPLPEGEELFLTDTVVVAPRRGHAQRMVRSVFEGTTGHPIDGRTRPSRPFTQPPPKRGLSIAEVDLKVYRDLRYRGPEFLANVAEIRSKKLSKWPSRALAKVFP